MKLEGIWVGFCRYAGLRRWYNFVVLVVCGIDSAFFRSRTFTALVEVGEDFGLVSGCEIGDWKSLDEQELKINLSRTDGLFWVWKTCLNGASAILIERARHCNRREVIAQ